MADKDAHANPWLMERRYFHLVIVSIFVILSAVAFLICQRHYVADREQTLKEDRATAAILSMVLDQRLKRVVAVMEAYSHRPLLIEAVRDQHAEKAKVHLVDLTKSDPAIDILIVTDRQGTLWAACPERPEVMGKNFAYREWYKDVSKKWKPAISDVVLRVVREKDLAIQISVPFIDDKGQVIGILLNTQRTVGLARLFRRVPLDPGASISVADRKGQTVYCSRHHVETEIKPYPFYAAVKQAIAARHQTFVVDDPDLSGGKRYVSFSPVGDIGWTVFVGRDKGAILLSGLGYYIQVTAIALLLFLSIILFLAYSRKQVIAQQIREQLLAGKKIRAGEERYKSYIDITMQLAWTTNGIGELVEANPSWSAYTGSDYEAIKGFGWLEDIHPEDRDPTEKAWRKAVEEKGMYETEYRLRRYDGVYRDYLVRGVPLFADDGSVREWVGACIDITDRKKAEKQIQRQGKILAAINDVFRETIAAQSEQAVAETCLRVGQELTGSKFGFIGEITPTGLFTTYALSDPGWEACRIPKTRANVLIKDMAIRGIWGQVILKKQSLIVNDPGSHPDRVGIPKGHPALTSFLGVPLMDQKKVMGMIAMANRETGYAADHQKDIEALCVAFVEALRRKKAEREILRLNEELEQRVIERTAQLSAANKELEAFSYSVSHDLRAPLRSIDGFSQALLEDYQEKLDDMGKDYLERVRKATQRMGLLIDDMLKLSRITRAEMKHETLDLSAMIRDIVETHRQSEPDRAVDISVQEGMTVQGDPYLMRIAMENLVSNAFKFTGKTADPQIAFGEVRNDRETVYFVRDNGAGFDMAYAGKLFGAFQRLHTSDEFPGTGVGLATVQRIIHRHGGRVWAEGETGKGATFYFALP